MSGRCLLSRQRNIDVDWIVAAQVVACEWTADPVRRPLPPPQACLHGDVGGVDARPEANPPPRPPSHHRRPPSSGRRRPRHDQPLARPCQRRDHEPVRPRRPRDEARRAHRPHHDSMPPKHARRRAHDRRRLLGECDRNAGSASSVAQALAVLDTGRPATPPPTASIPPSSSSSLHSPKRPAWQASPSQPCSTR